MKTGHFSRPVRCAFLVALSLVLHLPGLIHQLFDPDEATIAVGGRAMARGQSLYLDVIDRKPPLPSVFYSLFAHDGPVDLRWPHLVVAVGLGFAAYVMSTDCLAVGHRALAGVLFLVSVVSFLPDNAQAANYAHIAVIFGACAMVFARRSGNGSAAVSGILLAFAVMSRQTWLIGIVPALLSSWMTNRRVKPLVWLGVAWGLTLAALSWPFGFGHIAHWVVAGNGGFLSSTPDGGQFAASLGGNLAQILGLHLGFLILIFGAFWVRRGSLRHAVALGWRYADLALWFLTACVAWASGFRFFGHYAIQALPPVVLVATRAITVLKPRMAKVGLIVVTACAAASVGLAFMPDVVRTLPNPQPLAAYVDAHSQPDDAILLWGNFPEVYWKADRLPGGAIVTSDLVTGLSGNRTAGASTWKSADPQARNAFFAALARHVPKLVVDTSPANIRQYGAYPLADFPQLHVLVRACYTRDVSLDGSIVYRLRDARCVTTRSNQGLLRP